MVVLIVEDEAIIAYCSAAMLEQAGVEVLGPVHTSAEALELARQLRAQFGTAIVFTTGRVDVAGPHSDTAVVTLTKPYDPAELPQIVHLASSLRRSKQRTSLHPGDHAIQ